MLNLKKPILICKLILLLLTLALLIPMLAGCQSAQTPSHESSYEPLSEEKIKEIKDAWETSPLDALSPTPFRWDLTSEDHYFGTHGDCVAILQISFEDGDIEGNNGMSYEVAGVTIFSYYDYYFFIYHNGEFVWLKDAYEKGWVTKDNIVSMAERMKNQYPEKVEVLIDEST